MSCSVVVKMCVCIKMFVFLTVLVVSFVGCVRSQSLCKLGNDAWMQFCFDPGFNNGLRRCNSYEPEDVIVRPGCSGPNRYSNQSLAPKRCVDGEWEDVFSCKTAANPKGCKLDSHPSVLYNCPGPDNKFRRCSSIEPDGTIVKPECNATNHYSRNPLPLMRCNNGKWSNVVTCLPECGRVSVVESLTSHVKLAKKGEMPWHASIYIKTDNLYQQHCGGSLVSNRVVITAAHPFWHRNSKYGVAVGKLYRLWGDERDVDAQKSDVQDFYLPKQFQGDPTHYQDDIAIVVVATAFQYNAYVQPVCLDFGVNLDKRQLQSGTTVKVASWKNGDKTHPTTLKVTETTYIDFDQCYRESPLSFKNFMTYDKICGKENSGTGICRGDSGVGLAFPELDGGAERYYLRGIASIAPNSGTNCSRPLIGYTNIIKHENFIKSYL